MHDAEFEHQQLLHEIRILRERSRLVASACHEAIWETDLTSNTVTWSHGLEELFGYPAHEVEPDVCWWRQRIHPDERQTVLDDVLALVARGETHWSAEYRFRRRNGSYAWVRDRGIVVVDEHGMPVRMVGAMADISEHRQASDKLQASETLLRLTLEQAPVRLWTLDRELRITSVRGRGLAAIDVEPARVVGCLLADFLAAEPNRDFYLEKHHSALRGESVTYETTFRRQWVVVHIEPLHDAAGQIIGCMSTGTDITDLRESDARCRELLESAADAIVTVDRDGRIVLVNAEAERMFDYRREELYGQLVEILVPDRLQAGHALQRASFLTTPAQRPMTGRRDLCGRRKDGSEFPVEISLSLFRTPTGVLVTSIIRDVTEVKRGEELRNQLIAILEATTDLVAISHVGDPASYINSAGRKLLGIGPEEKVYLSDRRPESARSIILEEAIPTAIREGVWSGESVFLSHEGEEIPVSQVLIAHKMATGEVEFLSTIARDIREQKRLEGEVRQAHKMDAIGRLAGGIAHDFNNLLTVILGYSDLLLTQPSGAEPARDMLREIKRCGERAAALTRQLLAFSRKQALQSQVLDLNQLVVEMEKMLRRLIGEDVLLTTSLAPDLGWIRADPGQIEQVIVNLAINARDAMPQGGHLTLETCNLVVDGGLTETSAELVPGSYVLLSVRDSGCGMDEHVQARIFEPFFTTKELGQGTGLGLATVYGIIKQSGGHVVVESDVGRGSIFRIYLPRIYDDARAQKPSSGKLRLPRGSETILLVEDDDGVRQLARMSLETTGYTVIDAVNGPRALALAAEHTGVIHLLVSDVVMPEMNGRQVADTLAVARPTMKVLFISGYTQAVATGSPLLQKPFTPAVLVRTVREVLDR